MKSKHCMKYLLYVLLPLAFCMHLTACKSNVKKNKDSIYSRHLQEKVPLTIITTPMPEEKNDMNLLLYLDKDEFESLEVDKLIDSLKKNKLIRPLMIVSVEGKMKQYGWADGNREAEKLDDFVIKELLPFIRKKAGIRKFNSIGVWGNGRPGISALSLAWMHADKIDKTGIHNGDFNYAGKGDSLDLVLEQVMESRKRPKLQYWIHASRSDSAGLRSAEQLVRIIGKKNISRDADISFINDKDGTGNNVLRNDFAAFLVWAFGN